MKTLLIRLANWIYKKYGTIAEIGEVISFRGDAYVVVTMELIHTHGCVDELIITAHGVNK